MSAVFPITADDRFEEYTATADQTVFAVPFPFQANADVTVRQILVSDDSVSTLTLTTHYTMTGAGTPSGGQITLVTGAAAGDKLQVIGNAVLERLTSIVQGGKFKATLQDDEHDRHRLIQQELKRETDRAVKVAYGDPPIDLPTPAEGNALVWRSGALANEAIDEVSVVEAATEARDAALAAQAAAETAETNAETAATSASASAATATAAAASAAADAALLDSPDFGSIADAATELLDLGTIT